MSCIYILQNRVQPALMKKEKSCTNRDGYARSAIPKKEVHGYSIICTFHFQIGTEQGHRPMINLSYINNSLGKKYKTCSVPVLVLYSFAWMNSTPHRREKTGLVQHQILLCFVLISLRSHSLLFEFGALPNFTIIRLNSQKLNKKVFTFAFKSTPMLFTLLTFNWVSLIFS